MSKRSSRQYDGYDNFDGMPRSSKKGPRAGFLIMMALFVLLAAGGLMAYLVMGGGIQKQTALQQVEQQAVPKRIVATPTYTTQQGEQMAGIPVNYTTKTKVDDQYTVAVDPKTGEMVIEDAYADSGANTTSVEGLTKQIVDDALDKKRQNQGEKNGEISSWRGSYIKAALSFAADPRKTTGKFENLRKAAGNFPAAMQKTPGFMAHEAMTGQMDAMAAKPPSSWSTGKTTATAGLPTPTSGSPTPTQMSESSLTVGDMYCANLGICGGKTAATTSTTSSTTTTPTYDPYASSPTYTSPNATSSTTYTSPTYTLPTTTTPASGG